MWINIVLLEVSDSIMVIVLYKMIILTFQLSLMKLVQYKLIGAHVHDCVIQLTWWQVLTYMYILY